MLHNAGLNPIVLEARNRIGGRMCAHRFTPNLPSIDNSDSEIVIQLGANWIHNCNPSVNPMFSLAQELEVGLHHTSPDEEPGEDVCLFDAEQLDEQGRFQRVSADRYKSVIERWEWVRDNIDEDAGGSSENDSLLDAFRQSVKASEDPSLSFGPCSDADWRALNWCFDRLSIDSAMPIEFVSKKHYCDVNSTGDFGEALVQGGYFQLLQHLATEFELDIRREHVVESVITHSDDRVTITCSNGEVFETEACLVTLPVGVLVSKQVHFDPVPPQISQLTAVLQPGLMNLVWLWYPEIFWPEDGTNFFGVARRDDENGMFTTFLAPPMRDQHGKRQPILMCQVFGDFAVQVETMTNEEIAHKATAVLRKMFGTEAVRDAVGCVHSSWFSDPFSRCSWATSTSKPMSFDGSLHASPSSSLELFGGEGLLGRRFTQTQTPSVFFAGEATHEEFQGTVHAAYLSGIREANNIIGWMGTRN